MMRIGIKHCFGLWSLILSLLLLNISPISAKLNGSFHPIYVSPDVNIPECQNIIKDDEGFMWIAYAEGLARYDGSSIKEYSLEYHFHRVIHKLSGGALISFNEDYGFGAAKYDPLTDSFCDITPLYIGGLDNDYSITCSSVDEHNNLWVGTTKGIVCYREGSGEWLFMDQLRGVNVTSITPYGDFLAVMESDKLHLLQTTDEVSRSIYISYSELETVLTPTTSLYDSESNSIFYGTASQGLFRYDIESGKLHEYPSLNLGNTTIMSVRSYGRDRLLVGTDGFGIYVIKPSDGEVLRHFNYKDRYNYTIQSNAIYDIFVDDQHRIYAATYAHGVQVLDSSALDYRLLIPRTDSGQPVNTTINTIYESESGELWVGTDLGVFVRSADEKRWCRYNFEGEHSKFNTVIMDIERVGDELYACGYGGGLFKIDTQRRVLTQIDVDSADDQDCNYLFRLYVDDDDKLWVGGLCCLAEYGAQDRSLSYYGMRGGVSSIAAIGDDELLYCAGYDMYVIDTETKQVATFVFPESFIEELGKTPKIRDIRRDGSVLYFATNNCGLVSYNLDNNRFTSYRSILDGDYRNILALEIDQMGRVWFTTSKGVAVVNPRDERMRSYMRASLSGVDSFVKGASYLTRDGRIMFGTLNGVLVIDPKDSSVTQIESKPRITDFKISYNSVLNDRDLLAIDKPLDKLERIELEYSQNTFLFTLSHIDFSRFDRPLYSWRLYKYDSEWSPISAKRGAEYRNVPPGDYDFQYRVYSSLDSDKFETKSVLVRVNKPWYASWYMVIIYVVVGLIFAFGALYIYFKQRERLESQERIDYYMNALHSLHTPTMLIKAPLEYLRRELSATEDTKHLLSIVSKNVDRISLMVNQQIDYQSVIKGDNLDIQQISLADYCRELMDNFWEYAVSNNVTLKLDFRSANMSVLISREVLDKVMDNLISNAIKYSLNLGEVTITVDSSSSYWRVRVHNMGCLIPSSGQRHLFKRLYRADNSVNSSQPSSGLGLLFTSRLVRQIGGSIGVDSDRRRGTTFSVKFPIATSNDIGDERDVVETNLLSRVVVFDSGTELSSLLSSSLDGRYRVETLSTVGDVESQSGGDVALILINMANIGELCQNIRNNKGLKGVDIIAITSKRDEASVLIGAEYGIADMVVAPYQEQELVERVERVLLNNGVDSDIVEVSMSDADREFIDKVNDIIKSNLANHNFNIDTICEGVCMSRSVFYNRMKSITSLTPNEMLRNARMQYAAELLLSKRYSIAEVSDMVGFADPKYFGRVFYKYYKCYPSKYLG